MADNPEDRIKKLEVELTQLQDENQALLKLASHDVRSPLNKIFALLNLLKMTDEPIGEEQMRYVENMEMVLSDGLHRMRNLTDLYAIETDSVKSITEEVDLRQLISRSLREQKINSDRKDLHFDLKAEPAFTNTDRLSVLRIFDQLISNAIKFTPQGKSIKIKLEKAKNSIALSVTDGGYGISEGEQKELYRKFKVLSTPTTGGESKTGVGLFIAQWNAKNIGGEITYKNTDGSCFTLKLPLIQLA